MAIHPSTSSSSGPLPCQPLPPPGHAHSFTCPFILPLLPPRTPLCQGTRGTAAWDKGRGPSRRQGCAQAPRLCRGLLWAWPCSPPAPSLSWSYILGTTVRLFRGETEAQGEWKQ